MVCLAIVTGVHGVHGEVVVKSYTGDPLDIKSYGPLFDKSGSQQFEIKKVRLAKKGVVARLAGVDDRNSAEALKGMELYIEHARLPEPDDEDEFYFTDLIGLDVRLADGSNFGTVIALHNFGAGDLIEIKLVEGKGTEIYPFTKLTVPRIDLDAGEVIINPPMMIENESE